MRRFVDGVMDEIEAFMARRVEFSIMLDINTILADEARTSFASKIGAGVADLIMEALGFVWRANAREIELFACKKQTRIPDFVYDTAGRHGFEVNSVIAVEAKGSVSKTRATAPRLRVLAQSAYRKQVRPYVGRKANGISVTTGYAVAFGAIPGRHSSTVVIAAPHKLSVGAPTVIQPASLSAAASSTVQPLPMPVQQHERHRYEHDPRTEGGGGGRGGRTGDGGPRAVPSGRIAFASYESVFELCGAWKVADLIRRTLSSSSESSEEEVVQQFWIFGSEERFLVGVEQPFVDQTEQQVFGIYEPSARAILQAVRENPNAPPSSIPMIIVPEELRVDRFDDESPFVVQGDGLASITIYHGPDGLIQWSSRSGWFDEFRV